jgi:hypothetical protein
VVWPARDGRDGGPRTATARSRPVTTPRSRTPCHASLVGGSTSTHRARAFVVTTAPTTAQVEAILWRYIGGAHRTGILPGRVTLDAKWYIGQELVAYGRKPADYDQAAFQGIHARYVLVIIDEAGGVPKSIFDAVDALATNVHARVVAVGNPDVSESIRKSCGGVCRGAT